MSPEMKLMLGNRESNSDGFTYIHGKFKQGRIKRSRNKNHAAKMVRNDKRSVKAKELLFEKKLTNYGE